MVEVLIALVIFSIGLLGLALLEVRGVTFSKQSQARTQAVISAVSMADRMTANPAGVSAGDYVWDSSAQSLPSLTDCSSTPCTPAQVANNDINEWDCIEQDCFQCRWLLHNQRKLEQFRTIGQPVDNLQ